MSAYAVSARGLVSRRIPQGVLAPMNALLFGSGQQGAWYDPSDLSTLFQDAAGTTPVTAMEQPVGRVLDLSGNGNHASQATTTKRGGVSRRVNLLTKTEDFSGAEWSRTAVPDAGTASAPVVIANDDGQADKVTFNATGAGLSNLSRSVGYSNTSYAGYVRIKAATPADVGKIVAFRHASGGPYLLITLTSEYQVIGRNETAGTIYTGEYSLCVRPSRGTSSGEVAVHLAYASLALATDAHLPYQWVNTATDYDDNTFKFPTYLTSDGIDDSYSSATGGGGNAGFFFSQAITVLGGAGTARTLFSDAGTNTGYRVRLNASNQLELAAGNGTAYTTIATAGTLAVGTTDVVQAWDDGTNLNVKIGNGATASIARPAVSAGTAGYTMGQDNGASTGYFNGRMYSTVYRKDSAPTQVQREAVAVLQRLKARMP